MNITTTRFARLGLTTVMTLTALGGMVAMAGTARAAAGDLAAEQGPDAQTCTGSGPTYRCIYCIIHDGGRDCFWVKVADPNEPNHAPRTLTAGDATGDSVSQMTPIRNLRGLTGE